jgi:diguanylate cyclase (GGDEF)-like protein
MANDGSLNAHDGDEVLLLLLDADGTILAVNSAWTDALGFDREESVGKPAICFVGPGHAAPLAAHLADLGNPAAPKFLHVVLRHKSGESLGALLSAHVLPADEDGAVGCEILTLDGMARAMERSRRQAARDRAEAAVMRTISAVTDILARTRRIPDFLRDLGLLLETVSGSTQNYIEPLSAATPWSAALCAALDARSGNARTSGGAILDRAEMAAIAPSLADTFGDRPAMALWIADEAAPGGCRHIVAALARDRALRESWAEHVDVFATALGSALSCLNAWEQQATLLRKAHTQSVTDPLTRIFNRYKLEETLAAEERRASRYGTGFSVIMADIDHFKAVNDSFGHPTGDTVLEEIAAELRGHTRTTDVLGRWGGEEFLIICVHTRIEVAVGLAELLKRRIAQRRFANIGGLTVSFGVAAFEPGDTANAVVARADAALYAAKRGGRNRVCELAGDPVPPAMRGVRAAELPPERT